MKPGDPVTIMDNEFLTRNPRSKEGVLERSLNQRWHLVKLKVPYVEPISGKLITSVWFSTEKIR